MLWKFGIRTTEQIEDKLGPLREGRCFVESLVSRHLSLPSWLIAFPSGPVFEVEGQVSQQERGQGEFSVGCRAGARKRKRPKARRRALGEKCRVRRFELESLRCSER